MVTFGSDRRRSSPIFAHLSCSTNEHSLCAELPLNQSYRLSLAPASMPCDGARAVSTNLSLFRSIYHHRSGYVNHRGLPQSPGLPPHLGRHVPLWCIESANMRIGELCPCALATASLLGERLKLIPQSANFKLRHWRPERQVGKTGGHDGQNRSTLSSSEASMAVRRCEQGGTNGASPYRGVRTAVVPCHMWALCSRTRLRGNTAADRFHQSAKRRARRWCCSSSNERSVCGTGVVTKSLPWSRCPHWTHKVARSQKNAQIWP